MYEQLLHHGYASLHADSSEHPLLISEPAFNTKSQVAPPLIFFQHKKLTFSQTQTQTQRLKLMELVFERFKPPAVFVVKNSVLTAFSAGRTNATIVDCGASNIVVSAVHEGFCLPKCYLIKKRPPQKKRIPFFIHTHFLSLNLCFLPQTCQSHSPRRRCLLSPSLASFRPLSLLPLLPLHRPTPKIK